MASEYCSGQSRGRAIVLYAVTQTHKTIFNNSLNLIINKKLILFECKPTEE